MSSKEEATECMGNTSVGDKYQKQRHYRGFSATEQGRFRKERLPAPIQVMKMLKFSTSKTNAAGYWVLRCPFHKKGEEKTPSLNLHNVKGNFLCHSCGKKGGDILKFYCDVTKKSFKEAAIELGAWEEMK